MRSPPIPKIALRTFKASSDGHVHIDVYALVARKAVRRPRRVRRSAGHELAPIVRHFCRGRIIREAVEQR